MPLFFELNEEDNSFHLRIMFDHEHDDQSMAVWLKDVITASKDMSNEYSHFIANQSKLTGQDRAVLVGYIDQIITNFCVFQQKMKENMSEENSEKIDLQLKVPIKATPNNFTTQSTIDKNDLYDIKSFNQHFRQKILGNIKTFLEQYTIIADPEQEHSPSDLEAAFQTIDQILYTLLIMRYNVNNYLIDK